MPKVTAIIVGDDGFVAFPPEMLDHLKVQAGDDLFVTEAEKGYRITRHDPEEESAARANPKA